ncbi:protease inhibitor I42 family protein [Hyphomonas johnsonii]|uniref:Putative lipoprotein n=1 Tax=Hyphomonas johnsonii MHS-2 TaxID=1280950 RepID=A0A059FNM5_9PROT|nr:protease inhibitor I42 family protein [Hyphomonas johnsonii]KCZ92290.1 putative lipoprotein [Hyphomonas johnsonii MHS-2]
MARTRNLFASCGLAAACLGLAACEPSPRLPAEAPVMQADGVTHAGADQNGGAVTLQADGVLRVELETIPTAGYIWEVVSQPAFLELVDEATRPTDPEFQNQEGVTGGNHFMAFDFQAVAAGTGRIEMVEHRPWEENVQPSGTWHIDVTAQAAP